MLHTHTHTHTHTHPHRYPEASFKQAHWGAFRPTTFIDPIDPLFAKLGKAFIEAQTAE